MTIEIIHQMVSAEADGPDTDLIQPSDWNATHTITLAADKLLGRTTGAGAAEEIACTAAGRALLDDADAAAQITTLGAVATSRTITSGNGLTGGGDLSANRTLAVGAGTGIVANADDVAVDKATDANVRANASNKVLTADLLSSAAGLVALTDAATVTVDWTAGINFSLTVTANRIIGNPSNEVVGQTRTILVQGNSTTDRTITFANQYLGTLPTITDCDSGIWYELSITCHAADHF